LSAMLVFSQINPVVGVITAPLQTGLSPPLSLV